MMAGRHEQAHKEHINQYKMAHMIGVAEYMRERAEAYNLDADVMYTVGLLHDIGYLDGHIGHEQVGADILNRMGLSDENEITFSIRHHGENPYDLEKQYGKLPDTLILMLEADMSIEKAGYRVGFQKRLHDIAERYGYDSIAYQTARDVVDYVKEQWKERDIERTITNFSRERE